MAATVGRKPQSLHNQHPETPRHPPVPLKVKINEVDSTETSQDGDARSNKGEKRVMDEDSMLESGNDDSWDLITLHHVTFCKRPMAGCSLGGTWTHLSCAKIKNTKVPDSFTARNAKNRGQGVRRASRIGRPLTLPSLRFPDDNRTWQMCLRVLILSSGAWMMFHVKAESPGRLVEKSISCSYSTLFF